MDTDIDLNCINWI